MSLHALGWVSSKLGLNITGRDVDGPEMKDSQDGFAMGLSNKPGPPPVDMFCEYSDRGGIEATLGKCWRQVNQKVGSYWNDHSSSARRFLQSFGGDSNKNIFESGATASHSVDEEVVNNELDENGLPVSKNWYYYDNQLGRWNVSPDAPESIRRKYEEKIRARGDHQASQQKIAPPPLPMMSQNNGVSQPPPPFHWRDPAQQSMPNSEAAAGSLGHRRTFSPRYPDPNYFNTTVSTCEATVQNLPTTTATQPLGGVYGGPPAPIQQSVQGCLDATTKLASLEGQPKGNLSLPPTQYGQIPAMPAVSSYPAVSPMQPYQTASAVSACPQPALNSLHASSPEGLGELHSFPFSSRNSIASNVSTSLTNIHNSNSLRDGPANGAQQVSSTQHQTHTAEAQQSFIVFKESSASPSSAPFSSKPTGAEVARPPIEPLPRAHPNGVIIVQPGSGNNLTPMETSSPPSFFQPAVQHFPSASSSHSHLAPFPTDVPSSSNVGLDLGGGVHGARLFAPLSQPADTAIAGFSFDFATSAQVVVPGAPSIGASMPVQTPNLASIPHSAAPALAYPIAPVQSYTNSQAPPLPPPPVYTPFKIEQ